MHINPTAAASLLATAPGHAFGIAIDTIAACHRHSKTGVSKNATTSALSTPAATAATSSDLTVGSPFNKHGNPATNGRRETTDKKGYDEWLFGIIILWIIKYKLF